jgi:hypothetical protein
METETLFGALGWEEEKAPPGPAERFVPAVLEGTPPLPPPGIYFGMPEEEYHALPALSSHGIRNLASSQMLYWSRTPFVSELALKREQEKQEKDPAHRTIGKAYHCRIMEGADEFHRRFAVELTEEDCEGALESTDQIKAAIKALDRPPYSKVPDQLPDGGGEYLRAAKKDDWIAQLLELDPEAKILAVMNQQHREKHAGKLFVSAEVYEQIEIAARMVEADPEVRHAFSGGYAEVVLIWYCLTTGVPMKARVDYLKQKAAVDLKTIANQRGMSMERAIANEVAGYKYTIQPSVYVEGIQEVKRLVREDERRIQLYDGVPDSEVEDVHIWAKKWAAEEGEPEWLWVFQQKGDAPITRGVFYPLQGSTRAVVDQIVTKQKERFKTFSTAFGTDPWLDVAPIYDMADEDLPPWATDI